ncbi:MAG: hypothetical protein H0X24_25425 [Ktedonobacterales bacterium]|nr:hypothetical protein [Ktedonobacterales bacterium]
MDDELTPQPDMGLYLKLDDPIFTYYQSHARAAGMVFSLVVKRLISKLYRDHDFLKRRQEQGKAPTWDDLLREDMAALTWLITAALKYVPDELQRLPVPPQPPRPRKTNNQQRAAQKQRQADAQQRDIRYQQEEK